MLKRIVLIVVSIVIAIIAFRIYYHHHRMQPQLNVGSKRFITLYGHVQKGLYLKFMTYYFTKNKACQYYTSWIEGAMADRNKEFVYPVKLDDKNNYHIKIPLDELKKGYCGWRLTQISYIVSNVENYQPFVSNSILRINHRKNKLTNKRKLHLRVACKISKQYPNGLACMPGKANFDLFNTSSLEKLIKINFIEVNHDI